MWNNEGDKQLKGFYHQTGKVLESKWPQACSTFFFKKLLMENYTLQSPLSRLWSIVSGEGSKSLHLKMAYSPSCCLWAAYCEHCPGSAQSIRGLTQAGAHASTVSSWGNLGGFKAIFYLGLSLKAKQRQSLNTRWLIKKLPVFPPNQQLFSQCVVFSLTLTFGINCWQPTVVSIALSSPSPHDKSLLTPKSTSNICHQHLTFHSPSSLAQCSNPCS